MSKIRFMSLLCLGYVGEGKFIRSRDCDHIYEEIIDYFYNRYKNKPGSVIFFNLEGNLVVKQFRDLTINEMEHFKII